MNQTERMIDRIKNVEKFNDIAYLCEDFQSFVDEVQNYMGVYLTSLSYCNNRPHALTAFK